MKRILLIWAITVGISAACMAQNAAKYGDLVVSRPGFKNYVAELHIDGKTGRQQTLIKDSKGNTKKFQDEAAALNYVAAQGWEVVSTWYNPHQNATHFLLKKAGSTN